MAGNKFLITERSKLITGKLELLAKKLNSGILTTDLQTKEEYLFEAVKLIQEFYKDLNEPQIGTEDFTQIHADDLPDLSLFNQLWGKILDDLILLFTELENIEQLTLGNFNYVTTETNRLNARLKKVSSLVGDYILYSLNPNKDSFYFKDSFNDLSKIDIASRLLNAEECEVNQTEGIVSLPVDREVNSVINVTEEPIINPNSNGILGNNQEIGKSFNGDLATILDNNPDSWVEYEYVTAKSSPLTEPLVFDFTLNLGDPKVINFIRLNPNNFGTKTTIKVENIDTSLDGVIFTSIKDDIPVGDFIGEDEDNVFILAPSTSKFAGQGLYSFTPRKVKYVHITLTQNEPYIIQTASGEKLRYAIGLRDITIENLQYKNIGEIISLPFTSTDEIRKVLLDVNQNPVELSELAKIDWYISPDDGASWHSIQPKNLDIVSEVPEILEFNGPSTDTVNTAAPVYSVRVKAKLERIEDAFKEGSSTFNKTILNKAELHKVPTASPFSFELEESPLDKSITVVDPLFGSRGKAESAYVVGHAIDNLDTKKFHLPFTNIPRPMKKVYENSSWHLAPQDTNEWVHVEVGGERWYQASGLLDNYNANFSVIDAHKLFNLNLNTGILEFGHGGNTVKPGSNAPITIYFDAEHLFPSEQNNNHLAKLDFVTSNNKDDMKVKRYDAEQTVIQKLQRRALILRLEQQNITSTTNIESVINAMLLDLTSNAGNKVTYIDGNTELLNNWDWSINTTDGIIYLKTPTPSSYDLTVNYTYQPIITLSNEDWDWGTSTNLKDSISIKETGWKTITTTDEDILTTVSGTVFDLSKLAIVKNSVLFDLTENSEAVDSSLDPFFKEVDFKNGIEEFGKSTIKTVEKIASLTSLGTYAEFFLNEKIAQDTEEEITFTNTTLFSTLVGSFGLVNSTGKYFIDTNPASGTYRKVRVYTTINVANPGSITYFYVSPVYKDNGLYSIDYQNGKVYTQRPLDPNNTGNWILNVTFDYTDYRAEYRIARLLDFKSYDVDVVNKTITIKDSEILKWKQIPFSSINDPSRFYLVNYDYIAATRENITELKNSFTPVIKDYALRILTKGKIF
jgi:hypothetical protein